MNVRELALETLLAIEQQGTTTTNYYYYQSHGGENYIAPGGFRGA